jgi:DNA-binding MarR family transcriptional regulator
VADEGPGSAGGHAGHEGRRAGRARLGGALLSGWLGYRRRMDEELAARGFADRRFPDGLVLHMCARSEDTTISQIGRGLGISRQGASKVVAGLRDRGYVTVTASATSGREKIVRLTSRAVDYLTARREAARAIERQVRTEAGPGGLEKLYSLLELLGGGERALPGAHLRELRAIGGLPWLETD